MKNWDYVLVKAPEEYPYKKYRRWYCYEHHLVLWKNDVSFCGLDVHHIDNNKHNNELSNLMVLSSSDHSKVHGQAIEANLVDLMCWSCWKEFTRYKRQTHLVKKQHNSTYCSRQCAGKKNKNNSAVLKQYKGKLQKGVI